MATKKFTFKTTKPIGRFASFDTAYHEIKLAGKCCGTIGVEAPHKVRLMVMKTEKFTDSNTNCPWTWIKLAKENATVQAAKDWLNENFASINEKYTLYTQE